MSTPLRLLVVEDSEDDAFLLVRKLERDGYDVTFERVETADGMSAALENQPWDVVTSDYNLPRFSGPDALSLLKAKDLDLPFIVVSGAIGEDTAVALMKAGAHDYVMKSNLARLASVIQRELGDADRRRAVREADTALRRSEVRYRNLFQSTFDLIQSCAADGSLNFVNQAWLEALEDSEEEIKKLIVWDIIHPDDLDHCQEIFGQLMEGKSLRSIRTAFITKSGTKIEVEGNVIGLYKDDELSGTHGFFRDVTERVAMENSLRENEARLSGLVEHVPEGVCLLDDEGRITLANVRGQSHLRDLADAETGDVIDHIGGLTLNELLTPRSDGLPHEAKLEDPSHRVFEVAANPVLEGRQEGGVVLVLREVTREREVQERMQQQDQLAAVGQLAAGIAHDFNNMLSVMMGSAQILEMRAQLSESDREDLRRIHTQGKRATELIQQILDFSRQAVAERSPMDLAPLLKETVKLLERTLPETVTIRTKIEAGDWVARANVTQIQQVVMNLAVNARDAMPDGGELVIGLRGIEVESKDRDLAPGKWILLEVTDNGTGMPRDVIDHIYEPFFTTKEPGKGTGLGMAQVYGIVKQHEGSIDVSSEVGKGTTVRIFLPRVVGVAEVSRPPIAGIQKGKGEKILVVEDEAEVRATTSTMLELLNYTIVQASDGQEAQQIYDSNGQIDLVLTDVVMPRVGGIALAAALREKDPEVRVIFMSGYPLGESPETEGSVWLKKPLDLEQLSRVLLEVLSEDTKSI